MLRKTLLCAFVLTAFAFTNLQALPPVAPGAPAIAALADDKPAEGTISSVDKDTMSFVLKTGGADAITLKFNEGTTFYLDGKQVKWDEALKVNANAKVSHKDGVATKVEINTK